MAQQSNAGTAPLEQQRVSTPAPFLPHRQDEAPCRTHLPSLSTAYLASHHSNLLVKLSPVKARVLLQEREQRTWWDPPAAPCHAREAQASLSPTVPQVSCFSPH